MFHVLHGRRVRSAVGRDLGQSGLGLLESLPNG